MCSLYFNGFCMFLFTNCLQQDSVTYLTTPQQYI